MNNPFVDREICGYCGACISVCPTSAIELVDIYLRKNPALCIGCLACVKVCPVGAMKHNANQPIIDAEADEADNHPASIVKQVEFGVLVIGGGPAGSTAARAAAQQNVDVLMVEKRQEIGVPVRCAEGVSKRALVELTQLDPKWIAAQIKGARIHAPDGNFVTIDNPDSGLILERKIFDREMAAQAARSGAQIWVKARAIDLIKDDGGIAGAIIRRQDGDYAIKARVVIAADGVESQVGKWAGIDTTCKVNEVDTCAQFLMTGIEHASIFDPVYCDFFLGHQIAPRGYAWIFPKGDSSANVGVGIGGHISDKTAIAYLKKFIENKFSGASILSMVVGCVPVSGVLPELVKDGFMIIGDAAHQNDPMSGGGIINSMIAGQIAGQVAGQAVRNGDVSRSVLTEYEKLWHERVGRAFRNLRRLREGVLKFSDNTFNDIARVLSQSRSKKLTMMEIFWTALKNEPKLLLELRHLISIGWLQQE